MTRASRAARARLLARTTWTKVSVGGRVGQLLRPAGAAPSRPRSARPLPCPDGRRRSARKRVRHYRVLEAAGHRRRDAGGRRVRFRKVRGKDDLHDRRGLHGPRQACRPPCPADTGPRAVVAPVGRSQFVPVNRARSAGSRSTERSLAYKSALRYTSGRRRVDGARSNSSQAQDPRRRRQH